MVVNRRGSVDLTAPNVYAWAFDAIPAPPPWINDALCAQTDPESFYPEKGGSTREAKAICARCPVAFECLDYALEHEERFGIWGGLSERERRKLRHQLNPKNFPTDGNDIHHQETA